MGYFRRFTKNVQYATKNHPAYGMKYPGLANIFGSIINRRSIKRGVAIKKEVPIVEKFIKISAVDGYIKNGIIKIKNMADNLYIIENGDDRLGLTNELGEIIFNTTLLDGINNFIIEIHPILPGGTFKGQIIPEGTVDTFTDPPSEITDIFSNIFINTESLNFKTLLISPVTTLKTKIAEKKISSGSTVNDAVQDSDIILQKVTGLSTDELNFGNPYQKIITGNTNNEKQSGLKTAKVIEQIVSTITTTESTFKEVLSSSDAIGATSASDAQNKKREAINEINSEIIYEKVAIILETEAESIVIGSTNPDNNMFTSDTTTGITASGKTSTQVNKDIVKELVEVVKDTVVISDSIQENMATVTVTKQQSVDKEIGIVTSEGIDFNSSLIKISTIAETIKQEKVKANEVAETNIENTNTTGFTSNIVTILKNTDDENVSLIDTTDNNIALVTETQLETEFNNIDVTDITFVSPKREPRFTTFPPLSGIFELIENETFSHIVEADSNITGVNVDLTYSVDKELPSWINISVEPNKLIINGTPPSFSSDYTGISLTFLINASSNGFTINQEFRILHGDDVPTNDIAPFTYEYKQKLTDADGNSYDQLGRTVFISSDGNTIVSGAPYDKEPELYSGAVHIWRLDGDNYVYKQKLIDPTPEITGVFGFSISISSNSDTIVVGSYYDDDNGLNSGAVHVWKLDGDNYVYKQNLTDPSGNRNDNLGYSVFISSDGNTIVSGAPRDKEPETYSGALHVWKLDGDNYEYKQKLTDSVSNTNDQLGSSVVISSNGEYIVGGAIRDDEPETEPKTDSGALHVWKLDGVNYVYKQKLIDPSGNDKDYLGDSFSISSNGEYIVAGNKNASGPGEYSGALHVWKLTGDNYVYKQKLIDPSGNSADNLGYSIAIDLSGNYIVAGAIGDDDKGLDSGAVHLWTLNSGEYLYKTIITNTFANVSEKLGWSVSISPNGNTLVSGAIGDNTNGTFAGALHVWKKVEL